MDAVGGRCGKLGENGAFNVSMIRILATNVML